MSDNHADSNIDMIDAVLAGLPEMPIEPAKMKEGDLPKLGAPITDPDHDLEPGQIPPSCVALMIRTKVPDAPDASGRAGQPLSTPVDPERKMARNLFAPRALSTPVDREEKVAGNPFAQRVRTAPGPLPKAGTPQARFRENILGGTPLTGTPQTPLRPAIGPRNIHVTPNMAHKSSNSPNQGRRGGSEGTPPLSSAPRLLSLECQKRGFNPEWRAQITKKGRYTCDVLLRDVWIYGLASYFFVLDAKQTTAQMAYNVVRQWPVPRKLTGEGSHNLNLGRSDGANGNGVRSQHRIKQEDERPTETPARRAKTDAKSNDHSLATQVTDALGIRLPENMSPDPEVTRAFLEGVSVGSRLLGTTVSGLPLNNSRRGRSRSRSPVQARRPPADRYRARSLTGPRFQGTSPPKYAHYPGRPSTDRYRTTDRYRPDDMIIDQEELQGVVQSTQAALGDPLSDSSGHDGYSQQQYIKREEE